MHDERLFSNLSTPTRLANCDALTTVNMHVNTDDSEAMMPPSETQAFVDSGVSVDLDFPESLVGFINVADRYSSLLVRDENFR